MLIDSKFDDMTLRQINRVFRDADESHLWPIHGKFNVTERAIRQVRASGQGCDGGYEYATMLEDACSQIVNDERNW